MPVRTLLSFASANLVLAGVLLMLGGDFMFALNDAMGKWLVASFSVGQLVLIRSLGAFIVLGPMIAGKASRNLSGSIGRGCSSARVVLATADTALFYAAVVYLPLADVMTFYMAGPIYVAALSHLLLGEKVGWRRWLAILLGFGGVLIMLDPSSASLSLPSIFALVGSVAFAHDDHSQPSAARHQRHRAGDMADARRARWSAPRSASRTWRTPAASTSRRCCCWASCRALPI